MEKIEIVGSGMRPALHLKLLKFPVTFENKVVGTLTGRFKCQFTTDTELKNDMLQAKAQDAIKKAKRNS